MATIKATWIDPEINESLDGFPDFDFSIDTLPAMRAGSMFEPQSAPDIERLELTTEHDGVALSLLRPVEAAAEPPVLFWMHGGGMVIGNRHMDDARLIEWCRWLGCVCVSVEYRLAPESPYPTPLDDCESGLRFLFEHAHELQVDPQQVGIAGRSAGGALAAGLALRWRDNENAHLAFQYLEYPMLDDRGRTASSQLEGLPVWTRESNAFGWRSYLGDRYRTEDVPEDAAPARATELRGLPSTFIAVGTADCLRDESIDFAARLSRAAVPTELHVYSGAVHGFDMFADTAVARTAARDSADWLARQFGRRTVV
ncbi:MULTISPECIES: alpha/beta hydrolase [Mycobacterium]|uniref:Lipase n=2 Tax=Mycobacterium TaxID=1763 RepID=A0A1X1Z6R0_9MYCO|nr:MULTISPECIES: alpha/beta hydrolase [Mycobacterium]KLO39459.1 lipase [Mycobacterium nebraskense]MBZ4517980.1 alpha/beta hydrolase [Mycobacterium avium subsp. hominissuis]MBZ4527782.1 alpha/beta hydrolase [Mycobacterium avium subsp. hominissuis]MBZ4547153.1 alpha/beta hydrolase [Mycobacterium avium subsp. hominissuis]MBZ4556775.1 alpha/beta hydrolase [Mycobacterium avium subsp. hominissuis]